MLAPGDFSGDGKPDLLARDGDGRLLMYRGNGAGGVRRARAEPSAAGWGRSRRCFAPGDFSGDGKPDVLARDTDGALLMYRGDGDGGWVTGKAEKIGSGWGPFTSILAGGDFSGDGKPDVLAVNVRRRAAHVPRQRRRRLGHRHRRAGRLGLGARSPRSPRGGDFTGDGKADVLARSSDGALLPLPRQRRRRLAHGHRRADRQRLERR